MYGLLYYLTLLGKSIYFFLFLSLAALRVVPLCGLCCVGRVDVPDGLAVVAGLCGALLCERVDVVVVGRVAVWRCADGLLGFFDVVFAGRCVAVVAGLCAVVVAATLLLTLFSVVFLLSGLAFTLLFLLALPFPAVAFWV